MTEMNETSALEKQLLLWTPRHPSARLERRLFAAHPAPAEALSSLRFSWLAPATAAVLLLCVLFNQRFGSDLAASTTPGPLVAMILSNQSAAAYLPGSFQAEQNNLPANAFNWSRHGDSPPRATPLSRFQ